MKKLIEEIKACTVCKHFLPYSPRPVFSVSKDSKILIIGQAPGQKVHGSGIPWDDLSGNELRRWLGVSKEQFYNTKLFGLMPMGFCYPGKNATGDLPPRTECAPLWHHKLLANMNAVKLILLIGQYSQKFYLDDKFKPTLTENVKNYREFLPKYLPLVHPSPRNKIWQKKNPWFELEVVPQLRKIVKKILSS
jgi:uracil-DNA glycosylase